MDLKEKLLTHLFCNLVQILQAALGQWSDLTQEEINIRKALKRVDVYPIMKFGVGPFENLDAQIYRTDHLLEEVESNKRIEEKLSELKTPETIQTESQKTQSANQSQQESVKEGSENVTSSKVKQTEGVKTLPTFTDDRPSEASKMIRLELRSIKNEVKSLRKLAEFLRNLKRELDAVENKSSIRNHSRILETIKKIKKKGKTENINWTSDKNGFEGMNNNIAYNNQYQIDGIFIINRLSEGKETSDSKFNDYKEPDVEIFNELTATKMGEFLVEKLNYLNGENISKGTGSNCSSGANSPLDETEIEFLKDFQRNFSRIFPHQNITIEDINHVIKVIDFVDRYRGTVTSSDTWPREKLIKTKTNPELVKDGLKKTKNKEVDRLEDTKTGQDGIRTNRKVLCDGDLDLFKIVDLRESSVVKKNGSIN